MSERLQLIFVKVKVIDETTIHEYITVKLPTRDEPEVRYKFLNDSNIESKLKKSTAVFIDLIDEHMCKESGYTLKSFIGIEMDIDEYEPMRGSSYIDLPKFL